MLLKLQARLAEAQSQLGTVIHDQIWKPYLDQMEHFTCYYTCQSDGLAITKHYDLLGNTLKEHNFHPKNIYGFDESSSPLGSSKKTCVIGGAFGSGKTQCDNKENVTVMVCRCTNGSNVPPVVILKGRTSWRGGNRGIQLIQHKCYVA